MVVVAKELFIDWSASEAGNSRAHIAGEEEVLLLQLCWADKQRINAAQKQADAMCQRINSSLVQPYWVLRATETSAWDLVSSAISERCVCALQVRHN